MWLLAGLLRWDRRAVRLRPLALQSAAAAELLADLTPGERMASWHLISPSGERSSAGAAFVPLFRLLPGGGPPAAMLAVCPAATEHGYRWVAEHRALLSKPIPARAKRRARERVARREGFLQ